MSTLSAPSPVSTPAPRFITFQANRRGMRTVYDTVERRPSCTVTEDYAYELAAKFNAEQEVKAQAAPVIRTRVVRCPGCKSEHSIPADNFDVQALFCGSCRKSNAWAEARKLAQDVLDLRRGTGVFTDLTLDERLEQLAALGIGQQQEPQVLQFDAKSMPQVVRRLASDVLIDVVAHAGDEIARRLGSCDIADADRVVVPVDEAGPSVDEYAVDSPTRIAIEDQIEDEARELVLASEAAEAQDGERWDGLS